MKINLDSLKNTFVIGDVHGCYYTLLQLIEQFPKNSTLIFLGDLCDKGNYSKEVIEYVINNNHLCVKGNHEHLFEKYIIDAVKNNIHSKWSSDIRYGGLQCIESYKGDTRLIEKHLLWIKKLPMYIEVGKFFITHGYALEFYEHRDDNSYYNSFLLNRLDQDNGEVESKHDILNIFGHCGFDEVKSGKKYICLDTNCPNNGKLSAMELSTSKVYQQDMDKRDSTYKIDELKLKDLEKIDFDELDGITLDEGCKYASFDIVSNEVLGHVVKNYPSRSSKLIKSMKEKSVIFPKQADKFLTP